MSRTHEQTIIADWLHSCRGIAALPVPGGVPYSRTHYNYRLVAQLWRHCCTTCSWWSSQLTYNRLVAQFSRHGCTPVPGGVRYSRTNYNYRLVAQSSRHGCTPVHGGVRYSRTNYNYRLVAQLSWHCCTTCSWWYSQLTYKL